MAGQKPPKKAGLPLEELSRRERQIMDALYRLGSGSAAEIRELLTDPPTYTAVRTHLTLLEEKGHVTHQTDGPRYVYSPVVPREEMGQRMIDGVVRSFFNNSVEQVLTALVKRDQAGLSPTDFERLAKLIDEARKEGR
jgi:predicted transcriptional regulator